jgi:hypothetical protein
MQGTIFFQPFIRLRHELVIFWIIMNKILLFFIFYIFNTGSRSSGHININRSVQNRWCALHAVRFSCFTSVTCCNPAFTPFVRLRNFISNSNRQQSSNWAPLRAWFTSYRFLDRYCRSSFTYFLLLLLHVLYFIQCACSLVMFDLRINILNLADVANFILQYCHTVLRYTLKLSRKKRIFYIFFIFL